MSQDISGFGTIVTLVASNTFPNGIQITDFADDADSFDLPSVEIGQAAMGMNGNLVSWDHAVALPITMNLIPNSADDQNVQVLANNNRVANGKLSAHDVITITLAYPDGTRITLANGKLTNAPFGNSVAANGRMKTKAYAFMFESANRS